MRKSVTLLLSLTLFFGYQLFAEKVTKETAKKLARNFLYERQRQYQDVDYNLVSVKDVVVDRYTGLTVFYAVTMQEGGYVLVPADDAVVPVLGYSFTGDYTGKDIPENCNAWLDQYRKSIAWVIQTGQTSRPETLLEWKRLLTDDPSTLRQLRGQKSVEPLIHSKWDQGKYYNSQCPANTQGPDGHVVTGCVATAMGQILYYYRWPLQGDSSYSYQLNNYGTISADFGNTTYDWNNMQDQLFSYNPGVAELLFHMGVSVDMNYGPFGSGMNNHKAAYSLGTYFRCLPTTQYVWRDSTNLDWDSLVIVHLDRGQILYYAGWSDYSYISGHAFVCDGYQDSNYCHFNWGWSGLYDSYFYLNALNPGGSNFNLLQELIINIYPDTLHYAYPVYCQGSQTLHYFSGTLEDGSGPIQPYENNANCSWLIDPQVNPEDSVKNITLTFQQFDTESGQDFLTVYDGATSSAPVLGTFSGSTLPSSVTSTGNKVLVVFTSNGSTTGKGWFLSYTSHEPDYCGTTTLTAPSGTISDGSGIKNYVNNTLCTWAIQPPFATQLKLTFTSFHTEAVTDFLQVYDLNTNQLLGTLYGDQLPSELTAPTGAMYLVFKTNSTATEDGWTAQYTVTNLGTDQTGGQDLVRIFPNPAGEFLEVSLRPVTTTDIPWKVVNGTGQVAVQGFWNSSTPESLQRIDLSACRPGIYWLQIYASDQVIVKKFSVR